MPEKLKKNSRFQTIPNLSPFLNPVLLKIMPILTKQLNKPHRKINSISALNSSSVSSPFRGILLPTAVKILLPLPFPKANNQSALAYLCLQVIKNQLFYSIFYFLHILFRFLLIFVISYHFPRAITSLHENPLSCHSQLLPPATILSLYLLNQNYGNKYYSVWTTNSNNYLELISIFSQKTEGN